MQETRIVIVGGGPVGMALAVTLGLRNIACVLVEPGTGSHRIPKGQNLTQRTLEHFYFWGIVDDLRQARVMPPDAPIGEITAYGDLASDYWHAPRGRELVRPYYFQDNDRMPQYRMEEVLRARLVALPSVDARFGWQATGIAQDADGVRVTIANEATKESETIAADYAAGCDGGGSMVREASGISRSGTDFDQLMVLVVFRSRELHEKLKRFPPRSTYRVLHPELKGYWNSSAASMSARASSFMRRSRETRSAKALTSARRCERPPASISNATSTIPASGSCATPSPIPIATAESPSPATPRTRIRPMAASALTTGSRTR